MPSILRRAVRRAALSAALLALPVCALAEPAPSLTSTSGIDPASLDRSVQPCDNFYQFVCNAWMAKNPVPPDQARWSRPNELADRNRQILRDILERAAKPDPQRSAIDQKIGDLYASCMDEAGIEAKGLAPLKAQLDRIAALKSKEEMTAELARLHADGVDAIFRFGAQPDFKNAIQMIAALDQSGYALPDRDYYLSDEARFVEIRQQYPVHVQKMFELMGESSEAAARDAQTVLEIETALAKVSIDRVGRRDPAKRNHMMSREALASLAPAIDWNDYFSATGAPAFSEINVGWPEFFKGAAEQLQARSLDDWKTYLRWQAVHDAAPLLPAAFVNENFAFFEKTLTGAKELRPRWKRCVELTDRRLGEALGQRYVEAAFGPEGKTRTSAMVVALEKALERDIRELPWMTETTRKRAVEKLTAVANKIGYPDVWRDYSKVNIVRGDALGNSWRATAFETARQQAKIGQKMDPAEWSQTPPTVNAYYNPFQNSINFPAGILQPPFFDKSWDDAANFGSIGAVIGHELTHGFDDQGRKFDAAGNLTDWWTPEDAKEFEKRAACVADEYAGFTVAGGVHLNGRLTLGENTADNGGVRVALMALQDTLKGKPAEPVDGFTPEQRFFLSYARLWCQTSTPENEKLRAQTDPHSPGRYRVNGVLSNMPEFQQAFGCAAGSPMVRENACHVW
ncbi:MAG TPA: M13 family metallopeptidase [Thermoanaerobaculia bacterium]|jgi:endothelin-converting enzyme/putative endopeptidase|nr:M13 family metallopeptidase [Thermoanaerobaculia bacterium]